MEGLDRLETLRKLIKIETDIDLPAVKQAWTLQLLKQFTVDLISGAPHPWREAIYSKHSDKRSRMFIASSLFLFRKAIGSPPSSEADKRERQDMYKEKMCSPQSPPSAEVIDFATRQVLRNFKPGWDRSWNKAVDNFTLPTSSCLESSRSDGGARGLLGSIPMPEDSSWDPIRSDFRSFCAGFKRRALNNRTRLSTVSTGGKDRIVSVFSVERSFLTPLHRIIYDHISRKKWLLRGEAEPGRFLDFLPRQGEIFVSGDYESASDNLNVHLSEHILACLESTSEFVPRRVWAEARAALRSGLGKGSTQERGQLMGSVLSFPLLCITNFLALKFSIRRFVPLRINGDDIVFRATPSEYRDWKNCVQEWGLTLSQGKTLVSKSTFSLNSAFFQSTEDRVVSLPFLRSSCIFGPPETANAVAGRLRSSVVEVKKKTRMKVHRRVLSECRQAILGSQRSLRRGLQCDISRKVIKDVGLARWERFYMEQREERPLPAITPTRVCVFVEGWERKISAEEQDPAFVQELVESCWKPMIYRASDYWDLLKKGTIHYVKPPAWKHARMAGCTRIEYDNYLEDLADVPPFRKEVGKWVWVRSRGKGEVLFAPASGEE